MALGILELVCSVLLIIPAALRWHPRLTVLAATLLALESLVFVGVHIIMAFIAYGRMVLKPIA